MWLLMCVLFCVQQLAGTSAAEGPRNRLRLPDTIVPEHYTLQLQPFIGINNTAAGTVQIRLRVLQPTSRIRLHVSEITIEPNGIQLVSNDERIGIRGTKQEPRRDFITIRVRGRLQARSNYTLIIAFASKLHHEPKGFYTSTYWEQDDRQRYVAATQFWPALARKAFPCFDEPSLKATFDIILGRQEHMTALSNTPKIETNPEPGQPGWFWDRFTTTVPMSTYLVAFLITEFPKKQLENEVNPRVSVWSRGEIIDQTSQALEVGEKALSYFEEYFGVEFSLPKLDMVGLPLTAHSAMENWGLITYRESAFVYDPLESTADSQRQSVELVTHEVAHQWFGNLVSISWWTDLWLSEGFATYMAYSAINKMFPSWQVLDQFVVMRLQDVMRVDGLLSSHPVSTPLQDPARIHEVFDAIPYSKGASIIRMMSHILSEKTLQDGLSKYLNRFKFKNVKQDDLWKSLTEVALKDGSLIQGMTVKLIMDSWTLQPGYPVLQVERPDNSTAKLTQTRFFIGMSDNQERKEKMKNLKWWVPITFTDQRNPYFEHTKPRTWLRPQEDLLTVTGLPPRDKWVIFNLQQNGYFRVNYDSANWLLLIEQLQLDHTVFPVSNRAQLIDDSLNLARAGQLSYDVALNVTKYLRREKDFVPWLAAFNGLRFLQVMTRITPIHGAFQDYINWLIGPLVKDVGLAENREDGLQKQLLRTHLEEWACLVDHPACLERVQELRDTVLSSSVDERYSNVRLEEGDGQVGGAYCAAVRRGGRDAWQAVWRLFRQTPNPLRREALGKALGCTPHIWLLNRYLWSGLQGQDLLDTLRWACQTEVGRMAAWQYVWNNRKILMKRPQVAPTIVETVAQDIFSDHHRFMLSALLESLDPDTRRLLSGVASAAHSNGLWMERSYLAISTWLSQTGFNASLLHEFT